MLYSGLDDAIRSTVQYKTGAIERSLLQIMPPTVDLSSDILQPVPLEEWPSLQSLLKSNWPTYSMYYYWIQNATKWRKLNPDFPLEIYSPNGKYNEDATFVGISSYAMSSVVIFTKELSGKRLYEALVKTKRFNYSKAVTFSGVHEYIQPILFSALATLRTNEGIEIELEVPGCFRIKSAEDCANVEIKVPEECYLADLDTSHLPLMNAVWPHRDKENPENSIKFLEPMVTLNKSVGLFLKEGDILVSWALHSDWHGLGTVQTLDRYRRRGYAKVVINALAKQLGNQGISPILSVVTGNSPSENMFTSLNWKPTHSSILVSTKKCSPSVN
ncbi:uncharacterized protein LOC124305734 isoform X1 [Neodiprion virginianus]|uniref:uncharacterized protein LOC124305734 isoform X1 n=1 Tax=Neodiprion virginianus TaxID=2961670 RepID=UPI001EE729B4|nr:uncharacterized protein LOC124305734 isoform X1 [Neodiprion virginianus]